MVLLFVPSHVVERYNAAERAAVADDLGAAAERHVLVSAKSWYRATLIEPGFVAALNAFLFDTESPASVQNYGATNYIRDRVAAFWRVAYAIYYRLSVIWLWIPYLLPVAIPVVIDAIQERRVRQWRFSYVSPLTRSLATRAKFVVVSILIVALMLPLHVPATAYPILFAVLMLANWVWVSNLQKRI